MGGRNANRKRHKLEEVAAPDEVTKLLDNLPDLPQGKARMQGLVTETVLSASTLRITPVCWGIPFDEICFSKWVRALLTFNRVLPWDDLITTGSTYLPEARNIVHSDYLTLLETEWLMMLDSDVSPPPRVVDALLARVGHNPEIKMIGGWYRRKDEPYGPVVYEDLGDDKSGIIEARIYELDEIGEGLEQVDLAGAGCWLMHRSVAEAIGEEPYDMEHGGEDLKLCRKVREAGFDLWIDWDIACAHIGVGQA